MNHEGISSFGLRHLFHIIQKGWVPSMRVITGTAKGRKLITADGLDVRPTSDRVKEAMFSIVQFDVPGATVLDLFAGSGQLGIEALSRGAELCVFIDNSRHSQEIVKENLKNTGLFSKSRVVSAEYSSFLTGTKDIFDIALLDPPYHMFFRPRELKLITPNLSDRGIILCEHAIDENVPERCADFVIDKQYKFGKIMITAYRRITSNQTELSK